MLGLGIRKYFQPAKEKNGRIETKTNQNPWTAEDIFHQRFQGFTSDITTVEHRFLYIPLFYLLDEKGRSYT